MELPEQEMREMEEYSGYNYPRPQDTGSVYDLFRKVLLLPDSSKVGNLSKIELGYLPYSVRDCQRIAVLAYSCNHVKFGDYFKSLAEILLKTSNSKSGWFTELFVSQKRTDKRGFEAPQEEKKNKWNFGPTNQNH